jgi:MFS family permease
MAEPSSPRLITPAFVALTLSDLAYFSAAGVLVAATPLFATEALHADEAGVGLAVGSFSVTTLLVRPLAGRWADRHGRRTMLVIGAALFAVTVLGHYVVTSLVALVVLRVVMGAAEALYFVAGFAALADLAPPGRAGEALSLNSLALYLGVAGGPLAGQALLRWGGFNGAWTGAVVLALLAAVAATRVPETRPATPHPVAPARLFHPAALGPGSALFTGVAVMSGFLAFAVLQARAVGIEAWSAVLLVFGIVVVLVRLVFATVPDRLPPLRLAAAALASGAIGCVVIGSVRTPAGLLAGAAVLGVATAFLTPAIFAAVFGTVPPSERGTAAATTSIFIDLGLGGGPLLMGMAAVATSIPTAFLLASALPAAGIIVLMSPAGGAVHRPGR